MQNKPNPETNKLATTTAEIVDAAFIRSNLKIGRTQFYDCLKTGALPPPSFRVGTKTPRWFWSEVIDHLTRQNNSREVQSPQVEQA